MKNSFLESEIQEPLNLIQIIQIILKSVTQSMDITDAILILPEASSKKPHVLSKGGNMTMDGWFAMLSTPESPLLKAEIPLGMKPSRDAQLIFYRPGKSNWLDKEQELINILSAVLTDLFSVYEGEVDWLQVTASQRILPVTEEELTRIILDIHDGPVQYLFAAFSLLNKIQTSLLEYPEIKENIKPSLDKIGELIETALAEIRTFVGTFRPPEFAERDLIKLLEGLLIQHEQFTDTQVHLEIGENIPDVNVPVKIALYRIVQEALSNASHHASVDEHFLRIWEHRGHIHIEIVDHGKGFDPPPLDGPMATEEVEHIGLRGMRDRVHLVGGTFRLSSSPSHGTTIHVSVPIVN